MIVRKLILTALALLCVSAATPVAAQDVAGRWALNVDLGVNRGVAVFVLAVEGTAITGTYDGAFGEHEVTGIVDGSSVEFGFDHPEWGRFTFHGVIEGNSLEGTCEHGALGPGDFTGSREEEPAGDWA